MKTKLNSLHYGGKMIAAGLICAVVIPLVIWLVFRILLIALILIGAAILGTFIVLFFVEMRQDNGKLPHYQRYLPEQIPFDPACQDAVIRSSVCTGEKVAGFKNREDGHFTEVILIASREDEERFKKLYGLDTVKTEY